MYRTVKSIIRKERDRRKERRHHRDITRSLDALALTELGYPPKTVEKRQRPWFLHL